MLHCDPQEAFAGLYRLQRCAREYVMLFRDLVSRRGCASHSKNAEAALHR